MVVLQEIETDHPLYPFIEDLLHTAFPEDERRDDEMQRWNTDYEEKFHCLLTKKKEEPIGLLTYWEFDTFIYIEHLATEAILRGKGFGEKALQTFLDTHSPKPVVLEVEHPTDEMSTRRIGFYKRCGLNLLICDYKQPPYRKGDEWLPMYLMATPDLSLKEDYTHIKQTIYSKVYGIDHTTRDIS